MRREWSKVMELVCGGGGGEGGREGGEMTCKMEEGMEGEEEEERKCLSFHLTQ